MTRRNFSLALIALFAASLACSTVAPEATATPTASVTLTPSETPTPTRTPIPTLNRTATAEVLATEEMAYFEAEILPVLDLVGYSADSGELAFVMEEPVEITVNRPNSIFYEHMTLPNPTFANFILSMDIEWSSEYGFAGCDVMFRAEDDIEMGRQAVFRTLRLSGYPAWGIILVEFNQFQGSITPSRDLASSAIDLDNGAVNHYVLVVDGSSVTAYANGTRMGGGTMKAGHDEGQIAFAAWQSSGETTCTYTNAWVWQLPD